MIAWRVSDGTEVRFDGGVDVNGGSAFATKLRHVLASVAGGLPPQVDICPPPGGSVPLDSSNAWLLDRWLRGVARLDDLIVESEYDAPIDDAPPEVRELLATDWPSDEGVVY